MARVAGVSRTTASNVVMGTGRVSDETRARVRQAMSDLGYVYSQAAGSLRRQSSRAVGVVVTNIHRPHFGELLIGLESTLTEAGYTALMVSTFDQLDRQERAVSILREHDVAGLAMIPATGSGDELFSTLQDWAVPSVFVSRYVRGRSHPYVGADDVQGGRLAVRHLLEHGCRRIAYLGGNPGVPSRTDRIEGALRAIEEHGSDVSFVELVGEPSGDGGVGLGRALVASGELPDGVLCHGDAVAMGFERALYDAGLNRPGDAPDVRVIGYDGVAATGYSVPSLTTVETNGLELGQQAAAELIRALRTGEPVNSQLHEPRLIVRESCGDHAS
ncbi:LacI family transcriptional regulator [Microbacterium sp. HD4P20]|uniref:LacI family DNA-binding transcriptional regulator n=1 Tax=Microbacterium sp. HD4P20 TaxID=2864874 RepID=UPI001C6427E2|nr:LacI family DNA-binding transcriptional regulator [Microbacterium sp. HD4P20]MCP2638415.1 LacI family transcriptional regulator [Microbacterium sp. HD4P20]